MNLSDKNLDAILKESLECRAPGMGDIQLMVKEIQTYRAVDYRPKDSSMEVSTKAIGLLLLAIDSGGNLLHEMRANLTLTPPNALAQIKQSYFDHTKSNSGLLSLLSDDGLKIVESFITT